MNQELRQYKKQLNKSMENKIRHYQAQKENILSDNKDQSELIEHELKHTAIEDFTKTINKVRSLVHEDPGLPMICSKDIKLSDCKLALLAKGPKFSVRSELNQEDFEVELESMITKQKFNDPNNDQGNSDTDLTCDFRSGHGSAEQQSTQLLTQDKVETVIENDSSLAQAWEENKSTAVYNWEEGSISLARLRATSSNIISMFT